MSGKEEKRGMRLTAGRVELVWRNPDRYAVRVGGEYYSAFEKECPVKEGQQVAIAYVENGKFRNIKAIEVVETPTAKLSDTVPRGFGLYERETLMVYSVALKAAATCWAPTGLSSDGVKKLADNFAEWLLGKVNAKPSTCSTVETEKEDAPSSSQSAAAVKA
ncbi:MAG: hypothetical protein HY051_02850 [Candidatus Aenigmarchaeota archaeon]|nr:hypothetical protein [Candidatus Aenigmarchaeota archaeon]